MKVYNLYLVEKIRNHTYLGKMYNKYNLTLTHTPL